MFHLKRYEQGYLIAQKVTIKHHGKLRKLYAVGKRIRLQEIVSGRKINWVACVSFVVYWIASAYDKRFAEVNRF